MNVSVCSASRFGLTLSFRDAWNYTGGNGTAVGCRVYPPPTKLSKPPRKVSRRVLKSAGRVKNFALDKGRNKDDVRNTPTIVRFLREKLLDLKRITRDGE